MFIYMTINNITGKKYIGKSVKSENHKYFGSGKYLKRAIKKYGEENFTRVIIEKCENKQQLNEREEYWINYYDANNNDEFYNISAHAVGGHHGADHKGEKNPMFGKKHPNHVPHFGKDNGMYGVHRILSENPNAKTVRIVDPNGTVYVRDSIKELCIELFGNETNYTKMIHMVRRCSKGLQPGKNSMFRGWSAELIKDLKEEHK